jgi:hypothetical protein
MPVERVTLHDGRVVHLGRRPPRSEKVVLRLRDYLRFGATAAPPDTLDLSGKATSAIAQMYLNDQDGDCVIAAVEHEIGIYTGNESGTPVIATDAETGNSYTTICGPGDNGCVITDVLDYTKATGLTLAGAVHKYDDYVSVDWTNWLELQVAMVLFGPLTFGINLPQGWTTAPNLWDVVTGAAAQIAGGHCVCSCGYNKSGVPICTWASTRTITKAALVNPAWVEECYAQLSPDWYSNGDLDPFGVDKVALQADLAALRGGQVPPIPPRGPDPGQAHRHHHRHHRRHGTTATSTEGGIS